jgi:hypothetical protein
MGLLTRSYQNLLGKRPGLSASMPKAALDEAKHWLRGLSAAEILTASEAIGRGQVVEIKGKPLEVGGHASGHPK